MAKILIVDDDASMRFLVRHMVKKLGYQIVEAANGREGEHAALDLHPLLILLDIMMPTQDGYETMRHLRAQGYSGAITIISAIPEEEGIKKATEYGAKSYLVKPIDVERLRMHIEYALVYSADPEQAPTITEWLDTLR